VYQRSFGGQPSALLKVKDFDHFWYILEKLRLLIGLVMLLPFHFYFQSVISIPPPQQFLNHSFFAS
jgi:hypothetical protein